MYKIFLQEYELDEAFIKLNLNRNGNLYSIAHALPIDLDSNYELQEIQKPALNELYELRYWKPALKRIDEKWIQGWLIGIVENDLASELFVVPSGEILNRQSMMDATLLAYGDETKLLQLHCQNGLTRLPYDCKETARIDYHLPTDEISKLNLKVLKNQISLLATKP